MFVLIVVCEIGCCVVCVVVCDVCVMIDWGLMIWRVMCGWLCMGK